ncbi:DUF4854 domain-containing protein [Oscillospiraceae bacterium LCP25S3_E10]|nr:DUF4854 domain-containing protein [Ruminococcus sp.]MDD6447499.1 DUF4854 domain-containing protein [Ruminococcus sp.]MDY2855998.1 DUF4854 domain-containing protein [Oscillospiraceae bacterium]
MKKIFAVIMCAAALLSATACTSQNSNASGSSNTESSSSSAADSSKKFKDMKEYFESSDVQESIKSIKDLSDSSVFTFDVFVEDNNLVFEYKYQKQIPEDKLDKVKSVLGKDPDSNIAIFTPYMKQVIEETDIKDPVMIMRYTNSDGSVILELKYDKSILDKSSATE